MGFLKEGIGIVLLISIVAGVALLYFLPQFEKISIEKFEVGDIEDLSLAGFSINGRLLIKNPGELSVPIKKIEYYFVLEETGDIIGDGQIGSFLLEKKTTTPINFEQRISWIPAGHALLKTLKKENVYMLIKGKVYIDIPKIDEYAITFERKIDIKEYTNQFLDKYLSEETQERVKDALNNTNVSEIIENTLG